MLARIRPHGCKVRGFHQQQLTWNRHWLRLQWVVVPWGLFYLRPDERFSSKDFYEARLQDGDEVYDEVFSKFC